MTDNEQLDLSEPSISEVFHYSVLDSTTVIFYDVLRYPVSNSRIFTETESVMRKFEKQMTHIQRTSTLLKVTLSLQRWVHKNPITSKYSLDHAAQRLMHITHYRLPLSEHTHTRTHTRHVG